MLARAARTPNARMKALRFRRANYVSARLSPSRSARAGLTSIGKLLRCFHLWFSDSRIFRGCVTPQQIANVSSELEGDMTNLDGYEELPKEIQEKVARTFKQGHVDDEDWRGVRDFLFILFFTSRSPSNRFLNFVSSTSLLPCTN